MRQLRRDISLAYKSVSLFSIFLDLIRAVNTYSDINHIILSRLFTLLLLHYVGLENYD